MGFLPCFGFFFLHTNKPKLSLHVCITVCNWKALRWKRRIRIQKVWKGKWKAREDYFRLFKPPPKNPKKRKEFTAEQILKTRFILLYCLCLPVSLFPKDINTDDLNWHWFLTVVAEAKDSCTTILLWGYLAKNELREVASLIMVDKFSRTDFQNRLTRCILFP